MAIGSPPASPTLADAKTWLRVETADEDSLITLLIGAGSAWVLRYAGPLQTPIKNPHGLPQAIHDQAVLHMVAEGFDGRGYDLPSRNLIRHVLGPLLAPWRNVRATDLNPED